MEKEEQIIRELKMIQNWLIKIFEELQKLNKEKKDDIFAH
jgi:hypothetical protein